MPTQIRDTEGGLLWDPSSVDGKYTVMKAQSLADIIQSLMENISIKAVISLDEQSLANVYTKEQSDERYLLITNVDDILDGKIDGKIQGLIVSGDIIGKADLNIVNSRLLSLYNACFGTNFEGETVSANSYNQQIENLSGQLTSQYTSINRMLHDLYGEMSDGSVDWTKKDYALVSDTGKTSDLSSDFIGSNRSTLAAAINYTQSQVSNKDALVGTGTLDTTNKNLVDAVNEIFSTLNSLSNSLNSLSSGVVNLSNTVNGLMGEIESLKSRVQELENRE